MADGSLGEAHEDILKGSTSLGAAAPYIGATTMFVLTPNGGFGSDIMAGRVGLYENANSGVTFSSWFVHREPPNGTTSLP